MSVREHLLRDGHGVVVLPIVQRQGAEDDHPPIVHDSHRPLPRLAVPLGVGGVVARAAPAPPRHAVGLPDAVREKPREHEPFVREGVGVADRGDALVLGLRGEVGDDDPLDDRPMRLVALAKPQVLRRRPTVVDDEHVPMGVHTPHRLRMPLEGEAHTLRTLTPTDAQRAVRIPARRPFGRAVAQPSEVVAGHAPVARHILDVQSLERLIDRLLVRVGRHRIVAVLEHVHHEVVVAEHLEDELAGTAEIEPTSEELVCLTERNLHQTPRSHRRPAHGSAECDPCTMPFASGVLWPYKNSRKTPISNPNGTSYDRAKSLFCQLKSPKSLLYWAKSSYRAGASAASFHPSTRTATLGKTHIS